MDLTADEKGDFLNSLGTLILDIDHRWVILFSIGIVLVIFLLNFLLKSRKPSLTNVIQALLGCLMVYTGILTGSAFLLMDPPAVDALDEFELASIGLISLVTFVMLGVQQIFSVYPGTSPRAKQAKAESTVDDE